MKLLLLVAATFMMACAVTSEAQPRPDLRYWGKQPGASTGWAELQQGHYLEVTPGAKIPGWGVVKEVTDDQLVVQQVMSEAEKQDLRQRGALVPDILEIHIPRADLRHFFGTPLPLK